jgi:transcriptional regulator with XRE-family HTH domain
MQEVSMRLSEARAQKLLTVQALARVSGVSASNLYKIEAGQYLPSLNTVNRLAEILEVAPQDVEEFQAAIQKAGTGRKKEPVGV